jgi:hypothetical protein
MPTKYTRLGAFSHYNSEICVSNAEIGPSAVVIAILVRLCEGDNHTNWIYVMEILRERVRLSPGMD